MIQIASDFPERWAAVMFEIVLCSAYGAGLIDGFEAFQTSKSTADPVNGWDGDLLNAIGVSGICKIFRLQEPAIGVNGWTDESKLALAEYVRGCRDGVRAANDDENSHQKM